MNETELTRDFMMVLFIGSAALVAVVPVSLGLMRQPDRRNKNNKRAYSFCVRCLFVSFLAGIFALALTWSWFSSPSYWERLVAVISFGFQIVALLLGSVFYWRQQIERD